MPMSPNLIVDLVKSIRDLFTAAEETLLRTLARHIERGVAGESWADRRYLELQDLNNELDQLLDDLYADVPGAVERAMRMSYNRGTASAVNDLESNGVGDGALSAPPVPPSVVAFVEATMNPLRDTPFRVRRWTNDVYDMVTRETTAQVLTGAMTRREASAAALKRYAQYGVTGFVDRVGRNWELASYAEMAARTQAAQAALQGQTDKMVSLGQDLVIVSDAPQECALCRPWEGKVLTITGRTRGELSDGANVAGSVAEAMLAGLYHPNCRHSQGLYLPGITQRFTHTQDPEGDKLRQRQRAYERRIRQWKRRVIVDEEIHGKTSPEARETRRKLRQAQAQFKTFRDDNGLKNLAYRTSITAR